MKTENTKLSKNMNTINQQVEAQKCPICMQTIANVTNVQKQARVNSCFHRFCEECIDKWSKRKNNCPICRKIFKKIHLKNRIINVKKPSFRIKQLRRPPVPIVYLPIYFYQVPPQDYLAFLEQIGRMIAAAQNIVEPVNQ